MKSLLIIGIGQDFRSDDAIGRKLARELQKKSWPQVKIVESTGDGTDLMTLWEGASRVWLLDAVCSDGEVGTIHHFTVHDKTLPNSLFQGSTHHWGVAEAVEMGKVMMTLPGEMELYGIESSNFSYGTEVSPAVEEAGQQLLHQLRTRIEEEIQCTK